MFAELIDVHRIQHSTSEPARLFQRLLTQLAERVLVILCALLVHAHCVRKVGIVGSQQNPILGLDHKYFITSADLVPVREILWYGSAN